MLVEQEREKPLNQWGKLNYDSCPALALYFIFILYTLFDHLWPASFPGMHFMSTLHSVHQGFGAVWFFFGAAPALEDIHFCNKLF